METDLTTAQVGEKKASVKRHILRFYPSYQKKE